MIPPPPRSTLFPYTTLFRSSSRRTTSTSRARAARGGRSRAYRAVRSSRGLRIVALGDGGLGANLVDEDLMQRGDHQDRKSTRLNSSHPSISYAVFCLKKKKR